MLAGPRSDLVNRSARGCAADLHLVIDLQQK
jgi:hypothetical protein